MNPKRNFLMAAAASLGAAMLPAHAQKNPRPAQLRGPGLLTVTGAIGTGNRGALNPALDQLMSKQKLAFERAHVFDFTAISTLPAITIRPTLEYDVKAHELRGPLLTDVVKATGASVNDRSKLVLRAIDGYAVGLSLADARKYAFIVATHLDGQPMPLGGLGPLWAVYDADRFPDMSAKPVNERFTLCPWGLYHIEVQTG